ncbi:hypothetical protein QJS04_geneDACA007347 [Acorus gramineus]|uniref:HTH three-helical bundle domain-containing protein n=1 Tax=Acorus gramineus TaxID=55184 RepID=A0AAV9BM13_ACOGR|nr:hypothetical protein QJS04_geneDACA007347 [Acorus gramineus]
METTFPSPSERTVAAALLLLSASSPSLSCRDQAISSSSDESIADGGGANGRGSYSLRVLTLVAAYHSSKLKAAKKTRSTASQKWKKPRTPVIFKSPTRTCGSDDASSSTLTCASSTRPRFGGGGSDGAVTSRPSGKSAVWRRRDGSTGLLRRAEEVLRFLSLGGSSSEGVIRRAIGNNPDTSKALRMLLKLGEVKRSGAGGWRDPYVYMVK